MNQLQREALEGLISRPLLVEEVDAITAHLGIRNDVAIASILSVGRVKVKSRPITERGVRNCGLSISQTSRFLRMLRELKEGKPEWLEPLLAQVGIPADEYDDYADTLASAYDWLNQEAGVDIGTQTARQMLDLLALAPGDHQEMVSTLKSLAEEADQISFNAVSDALNIAEGRETL